MRTEKEIRERLKNLHLIGGVKGIEFLEWVLSDPSHKIKGIPINFTIKEDKTVSLDSFSLFEITSKLNEVVDAVNEMRSKWER